MNTSTTVIKPRELSQFALIWAGLFTIWWTYLLIDSGISNPWPLSIAGLFLLAAWLRPRPLKFFFVYWVKFGGLMGEVMSRIILLILFFLLITPAALVLKILRKDLLKKNLQPKSQSYWEKRQYQPGNMKRQF